MTTEKGKTYFAALSSTLPSATLPLFTPDGNQGLVWMWWLIRASWIWLHRESTSRRGWEEQVRRDETIVWGFITWWIELWIRRLQREESNEFRNIRRHPAGKGHQHCIICSLVIVWRKRRKKIVVRNWVKVFLSVAISFVTLSSKLSKEWNAMSEEMKVVYCEELKRTTETNKFM